MTGDILFALIPIVLMIGLGAALRHWRVIEESFWPQAERLGYYVLLPCLFFQSMATADLAALPVRTLSLTLIISTITVGAAVVALRPLMPVDGPAFTSVFQGSLRFNNYVGATMTSALFGVSGIAMAALCNAAIVPTVNVLCVLVFARFGSLRLSARDTVRQLVTNPLILSSLAGIAFQALGWKIVAGFEPALRSLGAASLPLGLLCVGAALHFDTARQWLAPILSSSAIKFGAMPITTLIVARALGLSGPALVTAMLFQSLPTASSAYVLARQLGGDAPLMAGITATQTVLALLTMPLVAALLF